MVYIPWAEKGICKYWMLKRCYAGPECMWEHPEPRERKRLWDYWTEQQELDEKKGIPRPKPRPKKQDVSRDASVATENQEGGAAYGPDRAPPPPPARDQLDGHSHATSAYGERYEARGAMPPADQQSAYDDTRARYDGRTRSQEHGARMQSGERSSDFERPISRGNAAASSPDYKGLPWVRKHDADPSASLDHRRSSDVSMLDAPPAPKNGPEDKSQPKRNANKEPLGKPNRLGRVEDEDTETRPSTAPERRRTRFDAVNSKFIIKDVAQHGISSPVPSAEAISVWKRREVTDEQHMTDNEALPSQGSYWRKVRAQKAGEKKSDVEDEVEVEKASSEKSRAAPDLTQLQRQTSSIAITTSSTLATSPPPRMGATKRLSNGETKHVGPHPSTIRVSAPYMTQAAISKKLQQSTSQAQLDIQERSIAEAREDSIRLQGVTWIDNVRRSLQLPIRTYTTACVYFHKFRLAHAGSPNGIDYTSAWMDACAASLLTSCKVEDTLKKSRDVLAAAYNLKATTHDQLGADDAVFEAPSRVVIGLERLVLESGGFDFRSKYPHRLLVKLAKSMPEGVDGEREKVMKVAWTVLTDLYRSFAPLKQTSVTLALASLELAAHLVAGSTENNVSAVRDALQGFDIKAWSTSREEIMETLLDSLDLYTQHTANTILGTKYSLDEFLRIRLAFNKECNESNIPRYTAAPPSDRATNGSTLRVANGHPTPVSPMEPGPQPQPQNQNASGSQNTPEGGGTLRFMLNPELASDEKAQVQKYFVEEWEEYEEEVEIPQPASRTRDAEPERERTSSERPRDSAPRGDKDSDRVREERDRDRVRNRLQDREREAENERARGRDVGRERRFGERRFEDRERRFDDRRDRRYEDRRYDDERRRRDDRR